MANPRYDRLTFHLLGGGVFAHVPRDLRPDMSRFTPSPSEYDAAMHEGISPALRRGPLFFSYGMPPPNDGVMHDMITSGSIAAALSPGFFTQEEARATEAVAAASRGGVDRLGRRGADWKNYATHTRFISNSDENIAGFRPGGLKRLEMLLRKSMRWWRPVAALGERPIDFVPIPSCLPVDLVEASGIRPVEIGQLRLPLLLE
jgi:hypothetical protein